MKLEKGDFARYAEVDREQMEVIGRVSRDESGNIVIKGPDH